MKNLQETVDFLAKYGIESEIKGDRVVVDGNILLSCRGIYTLPESFGNIECYTLDLSSNCLTALPDSIGNLKCKRLNLSYNKIRTLPKSIGNIKCKLLWLSHNDLMTLPKSLLKPGIKIYGEKYLFDLNKTETSETLESLIELIESKFAVESIEDGLIVKNKEGQKLVTIKI